MVIKVLPEILIASPQMSVRGVIFDMDGLLLDSESLGIEASMRAARQCGLSLPISLARAMIGLSEDKCFELVTEQCGVAGQAEKFFALQETCLSEMVGEGLLQLKPGALSLLDLLDARNIPRAIATSSSHARTTSHLAALAMPERFDAIVTRDDVSHGKPDPEPYTLAAARIGVTAELCLALEDSTVGVRAAVAAGMRVIMVPDLAEPDDFARANALAIVESLDVARDYLMRYAR
ncbi:HAD family hydrolase [Asaia bogorensis]|uniref:Haloacid dehalogenase n=1 Tax=Asaia bogorensis NBRC 16594 TaxID=1231624 RepID=A0AAN4R089_9PROT|nr:HAD family phosphatase [Asaia bogorensis]BAT20300.1 hydrolase/phosphatase/phosphohexomutase [Asaia bogorensis NBRC 16594]GBQ79800.1 phosphatase/phosphohexomutase [Asaia bogorensis NBRC 16594]GEL52278.1 haloacid dehalogenase [Asaia bogorensis NBRC 16594]